VLRAASSRCGRLIRRWGTPDWQGSADCEGVCRTRRQRCLSRANSPATASDTNGRRLFRLAGCSSVAGLTRSGRLAACSSPLVVRLDGCSDVYAPGARKHRYRTQASTLSAICAGQEWAGRCAMRTTSLSFPATRCRIVSPARAALAEPRAISRPIARSRRGRFVAESRTATAPVVVERDEDGVWCTHARLRPRSRFSRVRRRWIAGHRFRAGGLESLARCMRPPGPVPWPRDFYGCPPRSRSGNWLDKPEVQSEMRHICHPCSYYP
jgi:hypothetical protein